jgi:hypothetical protein
MQPPHLQNNQNKMDRRYSSSRRVPPLQMWSICSSPSYTHTHTNKNEPHWLPKNMTFAVKYKFLSVLFIPAPPPMLRILISDFVSPILKKNYIVLEKSVSYFIKPHYQVYFKKIRQKLQWTETRPTWKFLISSVAILLSLE